MRAKVAMGDCGTWKGVWLIREGDVRTPAFLLDTSPLLRVDVTLPFCGLQVHIVLPHVCLGGSGGQVGREAPVGGFHTGPCRGCTLQW